MQKLNRLRENKSPAEENDPNGSGMKYFKKSARLAEKTSY